MISSPPDVVIGTLMVRAARSRPHSLQRLCAEAVDNTQWREAVCAHIDRVLTTLIDRAPERGAPMAEMTAFHRYVDSTYRDDLAAALLLLLHPTERWVALQLARDWDKPALTFARDVMRRLSTLLVEGQMFWGDLRLADGPAKRIAMQWMPGLGRARGPIQRDIDRDDARAVARLDVRNNARHDAHDNAHNNAHIPNDGSRPSSADVAKVAFSVFQRRCRMHAAYHTMWVPPISWNLTDHSLLPTLFGEDLPVSWFVDMDRIFGALSFPTCRRAFALLLNLVPLALRDIRERQVCAYRWLVATPENYPRYEAVLRAHTRLRALSAWIEPMRFRGPPPCEYDFPRIDPLIDRLLHDPELSTQRVADFIWMAQSLDEPDGSSAARTRLRDRIEAHLPTPFVALTPFSSPKKIS